MRRHGNINDSLARALDQKGGSQASANSADGEELDWLGDLMNEGSSTVAPQLSPIAQSLKNIFLQHFRPIYLIFDQFEELFILGTKAEQAQFIATVQAILQVDQPVKLIFSIREEYLGMLYEFEKAVPELLRKKMRIEPMNLEKVRQVVLGIHRLPDSIVHIQKGQEEQVALQIFEKIRGKEKTFDYSTTLFTSVFR